MLATHSVKSDVTTAPFTLDKRTRSRLFADSEGKAPRAGVVSATLDVWSDRAGGLRAAEHSFLVSLDELQRWQMIYEFYD